MALALNYIFLDIESYVCVCVYYVKTKKKRRTYNHCLSLQFYSKERRKKKERKRNEEHKREREGERYRDQSCLEERQKLVEKMTINKVVRYFRSRIVYKVVITPIYRL